MGGGLGLVDVISPTVCVYLCVCECVCVCVSMCSRRLVTGSLMDLVNPTIHQPSRPQMLRQLLKKEKLVTRWSGYLGND